MNIDIQFSGLELYKNRRKQLVEQAKGAVLLVAAFEDARVKFHQDSTFFYYTGIVEPGCFCLIETNGITTLFVPKYKTDRSQWVPGSLMVTQETAEQYGFDHIEFLGEANKGYVMNSYFEPAICSYLVKKLEIFLTNKTIVFMTTASYVLDRICSFVPGLAELRGDIMPYIASMRRTKDKHEIQALYNAIDVTMIAHEAAAQAIGTGKNESQVAAAIDYIFAESASEKAFPSIVGSGINATVLHYNDNTREMQKGECVIVDIGACLNNYCGDLTRTYPVSGKFSKRQKEVYKAVLETQQHLAAIAQPGFWLRNDEVQEKSLYHIMHECLRERKLEKYIAHGVGHFLGLDVHDVGDTKEPLREGDVITIEPGVYIPEELFGVRIEDNYWIVEGGAVCLSEALPSEPDAIEAMVKKNF